MNINSILAWFAGLFKKGKTMVDQSEMTVNELQASLAPVAEAVGQALVPTGEALAGVAAAAAEQAIVAAVPAPVAPIVAAVVNTDVLKAVLLALGHNLEPVWEEAVALAKKAL